MDFLSAIPAQFMPVIYAAIVVFVVDLIGNYIAFGNRIINALVTAIIFGAIFAALVHFQVGGISMSANLPGA